MKREIKCSCGCTEFIKYDSEESYNLFDLGGGVIENEKITGHFDSHNYCSVSVYLCANCDKVLGSKSVDKEIFKNDALRIKYTNSIVKAYKDNKIDIADYLKLMAKLEKVNEDGEKNNS